MRPVGFALLIGLAAAVPAAGQTSLSIYRDGRVVVRQTLAQALAKGRNTLVLTLDGLDPATLFSPDTAVAVVSAAVRYPSGRSEALTRAVGHTLSFAREKGDTVRATVVRVDPPQYRLADGRLLLAQPGEPLFPAELVRTVPEAALVIEAARARPRTELAYVTQGATWEAVYQVVLGGRGGDAVVSGAATVTSQTVRAESADVQIVAGSIRRTRFAEPRPDFGVVAAEAPALRAQAAFAAEEAVGETHVYQLPGKLSLNPGVPVTTALFPRERAPYAREFVVPGVLPWRGYFGGAPAEPNRVPVQVWYTLQRGRGTPFGDRPLPAGTVQIYQPDSAGRVQLVGEAATDHTAAGRDLRVQSGEAFDLTAERVQTDYHTEQLPPARRGLEPRRRITAAFRIRVAIAKAEAVTVDVRESRHGEWRVVESSVPSEKLSATEVRFRLAVPAGGEATLTYTVQLEA